VAVRMMHQIFNCFVKNAIEVNQIAVIARYMTERLVPIVVMVSRQIQNRQVLQLDVLEQRKKD
jgi:hypothetical protein